MESLTIIKTGGTVLENQVGRDIFLDEFVQVPGNKILVHGGGKKASGFLEKLGIPVKMKHGRRITDAPTLEVVIMVYAGLINKTLVAELYARNCPSIGLCGADAGLILAQKRETTGTDYGFAGDINFVDKPGIEKLLDCKLVPVFAPLSCTREGRLLNTNADAIAAEIAIAFSSAFEVNLVYCFEKPGVLLNPGDDESVIPQINELEYKQLLLQDKISGGMLPKLDNCFSALSKGVKTIRITDISGINRQKGTILKKQDNGKLA
jgi:acetylglutamate kinase